MPGDCSPSRSVVSKMMTRSDMSFPFSASQFLSGWCAATCGRRRAIPPEGGGEGRGGGRGTTSATEAIAPTCDAWWSGDEHDLADVAALLEQAVRLGRPVERHAGGD